MQTITLTHNEHIDLHVPSDLKILLSRAAAYSGISLSNFLISSASERAQQVIEKYEILTLSTQAWEAFLVGLDEPDEPIPQLEAAVHRYRQRRDETDAS